MSTRSYSRLNMGDAFWTFIIWGAIIAAILGWNRFGEERHCRIVAEGMGRTYNYRSFGGGCRITNAKGQLVPLSMMREYE